MGEELRDEGTLHGRMMTGRRPPEPGRAGRDRPRRALARLALAAATLLPALLLTQPRPAAAQAQEGGAPAAVAALDSLRAVAREAGAPERAAEAWARAERRAADASRELSRGNAQRALEAAGQAANLYRQARLEALRGRILAGALERRRSVRDRRVAERAPRAVALADSALAGAERALRTDPPRLEEATERADLARQLLERALGLAAVADSVDEEWLRVEDLRIREDERLGRIARSLGLEVDSAAPPEARMDRIVEAVRRGAAERAALADSLSRARERGETLASIRDSLEAALEAEERRRAELAAQVEARRRHEQRLREVRVIFGPDEGEVEVDGDRLVLRLTGLNFPPGEAEVLDEHRPILTKVQRVLLEFPRAPVTVEGHTDGRGDADRNRALSQRRAIAIREYLLQNLPISADRIRAVGYGESRPVATDETEEGRRRNRRIDVVLDLSGGAEGPPAPR